MVREDILGGLRLALSKGESLQNAMQSFYNSGYPKEEIEEAARALHKQAIQQPPRQPFQQPVQQTRAIQPQQHMSAANLYKPPIQPNLQTSAPPIIQEQSTQEPIQAVQRSVPVLRPSIHYQNPEQSTMSEEEKESIINRFKQLRTTVQADQSEKVSAYGEYKRPGLDAVTIILIIILIALLGVLAAVFFFKEDLIEFLNKFLD
ncbi:hypothetical protein HYT23_00475 [Candidatus Pacearchaeota archaeon]|nr:hypothetical protein [Candidatus Pacearchaeota archaeon]